MKLKELAWDMPFISVIPAEKGETKHDIDNDWRERVWDLDILVSEKPELQDREIDKITQDYGYNYHDVYTIWLK